MALLILRDIDTTGSTAFMPNDAFDGDTYTYAAFDVIGDTLRGSFSQPYTVKKLILKGGKNSTSLTTLTTYLGSKTYSEGSLPSTFTYTYYPNELASSIEIIGYAGKYPNFVYLTEVEIYIEVLPPESFSLASPNDLAFGVDINPTLSWYDSIGAVKYLVQVSKVPTFNSFVYSGYTTNTSKQITNLEYNTTYYWRVTAKNDAGEYQTSYFTFTTKQQAHGTEDFVYEF